jgi:hypothetical protein
MTDTVTSQNTGLPLHHSVYLHSYVCIYVLCMYVGMYVRTYVCMYVCMDICMYIYIYIYVCMYACMYVCTMYVRMYVRTYVCMYTMYMYNTLIPGKNQARQHVNRTEDLQPSPESSTYAGLLGSTV